MLQYINAFVGRWQFWIAANAKKSV